MFTQKRGGAEVPFLAPKTLDEVPEVTDEERDAIQRKMAAYDKLLATQQKAKYKIELFFGKARSMTIPVPGMVSFWESGTKFHGGGDCKIYFCPGKLLKMSNCEAPIPFAFNAYGHLVCPACKQVWKGPQVIGEVLGRHNMRDWSRLLYIYFCRLDHNADFYVKHSPDDIRSVAAREQEKQRGGELLNKARQRALHIYPLRNLIKDTVAGADPMVRIHSFLTA